MFNFATMKVQLVFINFAFMDTSGIYKITNLVNGKIYVGRASFLKKRGWEHFRTLRLGKHHNEYLQKSFNKYGEINFIFEVIEYCEVEELIAREDYWCKNLQANISEKGYNIALTDEKSGFYKHSEETKIKISKGLKGKKKSPEHIENCRNSNIGKRHTQEHKDKIKEWYKNNKHPLLNKIVSEETKRKMSMSRKGKPSNNRRKIKAFVDGKTIDFNSITEAAIFFDVGITSIANNLKGLSKIVKNKIKFEYAS